MDGASKISIQVGNDPIPPGPDTLKLLSDILYDNIKGVTEEMSKKIRTQIRESILAREDNIQLAKRLDDIFRGDNPTRFKYDNRLKLIARTESTRAMNYGSFENAIKIGASKKYINIVNDSRTTDVSKAMFAKYGTEEKAIDLDEEFSVVVGGKTYSGLFPPFMPNDRDYVLYIFD